MSKEAIEFLCEINPSFKNMDIKNTNTFAGEFLLYCIDKALNQGQSLPIDSVSGSFITEPPKPPLSRVMREGVGHFCKNCGSTMSKSGFLMLFGKRYCDNNKCQNSKPPKNYR